MEGPAFALKGTLIYSRSPRELRVAKDALLVCQNGRVAGVFDTLPPKFRALPIYDRGEALIVPGFTDLHVHAPQYAFRGLGMDLELLDWLRERAFPEEAKYADAAYARRAYALFTQALKKGGATRAVIYATAHTAATLELMDQLEESGLCTLVGRVNMDCGAIPSLQEKNAAASLNETRAWLAAAAGRYRHTAPILTPRFIPSCSSELLAGLGALQRETGLAVQSHLSENIAEAALVKELHPQAETYAGAYRQFGLLGGPGCPTVMAHCVHSGKREIRLLAERGVWAAHCPVSNACLSSGIAPLRAFMEAGVKLGLGSDVAGGCQLSLFSVMADAVKHSKLRWRLVDQNLPQLTFPEVFWMATRGGGGFFGQVGAFEAGFAFDALVLSDQNLPCPFALSPTERLERLIYLGGDENVAEKYVEGRRIF